MCTAHMRALCMRVSTSFTSSARPTAGRSPSIPGQKYQQSKQPIGNDVARLGLARDALPRDVGVDAIGHAAVVHTHEHVGLSEAGREGGR